MNLQERLSGALAGRYDVREEIGRGGMAVVFRARDVKHDRSVAIKVLRPEFMASLADERFLREIQIAARLQHPLIIPLYDSGSSAGLVWYSMPYVEGETLQQRLNREGPLPVHEAVRIATEVAEALSYAHEHGIVHRDVKPANILLSGNRPLVADFGVARAVTAAGGGQLTSSDLAVGTPAYMSPEQGSGKADIDARSDIYSLCCTLFEMLAGEPPFTGPTPQSVIARHVSAPPPSLRIVRPAISPALQAVIEMGLAKVPADRFGSAGELARALAPWVQSGAVPKAPGPPPRGWRRYAWGGIAAAAVGVVALIWSRAPRGRIGRTDIVVLPFATPAGWTPDAGAPPHQLFLAALGWIPRLHATDGGSVTPQTGGPPSVADLVRVARRLGAELVVAGQVFREGGQAAVGVTVYSAGDGAEVYQGRSLPQPQVGRAAEQAALDLVAALAMRGVLDLPVGSDLLASTTSAVALGALLQAKERFQAMDLEGAANLLRRAIEADSAFAPAYIRLSVVLSWLWDYPAAWEAIEQGRSVARADVPRWRALLDAQRWYVLGRVDSALAGYQAAALDYPNSADAWLGLAESLYHFGPFAGHCASDALAAFDRLLTLDSAFAPIHYHLVDLAMALGDEARTDRYLARMPAADPDRAGRTAASVLQFGSPSQRDSALAALAGATRQVLSPLVVHFGHSGIDLPLADTLAGLLMANGTATPDDRIRGAQYRLAARAADGRWQEGAAAWSAVAGGEPFDDWMVQAYLAGFPADRYARPMFRWANALVLGQRAPDFRLQPLDTPQLAFIGLVDRALMEGDGVEVARLSRALDARAGRAHPTDPLPDALRATLAARLAMLTADTSLAISLLERSVTRRLEHLSSYFPLTQMAPQRMLLAELYAARGDWRRATKWMNSFAASWALGDVLYQPRLSRLRSQRPITRGEASEYAECR